VPTLLRQPGLPEETSAGHVERSSARVHPILAILDGVDQTIED
jgi:hypothetical protein